MKSRILITSDIYRRLLNKARQSDLTADELAEAYLKKQLKLRWISEDIGFLKFPVFTKNIAI